MDWFLYDIGLRHERVNCCKMQIVFKNKTRLGNKLHFKDRIAKDFTFGVAHKFQCGLCNEC